VNSFLADGGDGFEALREGTQRLGGPQDLDALVRYLDAAGTVVPPREARVLRAD
jgi:5'-nucleotidase